LSSRFSERVRGAQGDDETSAGRVAEHNDADVTFVQGMIPHHRQAVEMAEMVLTSIHRLTGPDRGSWGYRSAKSASLQGMIGFAKHIDPGSGGTFSMRSCHVLDRVAVTFDDEHAVAAAGLVLPATLAGRLGIEGSPTS
jgi:hypothetical protein